MWIKLRNSAYKNNPNSAIHEQDILTRLSKCYISKLPQNIKNMGNGKIEIDPKIAYTRYKGSINNFGIKRSRLSSRLTELKIFFHYTL